MKHGLRRELQASEGLRVGVRVTPGRLSTAPLLPWVSLEVRGAAQNRDAVSQTGWTSEFAERSFSLPSGGRSLEIKATPNQVGLCFLLAQRTWKPRWRWPQAAWSLGSDPGGQGCKVATVSLHVGLGLSGPLWAGRLTSTEGRE